MKKKNKKYGIIGLGRFGTALAYKLASTGAEIMVTDKDEVKVAELREITENAFIAGALEKKTLSDMGFQNCDVVIVCIAGAIDVSILTVMKLQSIGCKRIIAKANSAEHGEILAKIGAEIVYPEQDMAYRLANRLDMGTGLDFIELSNAINVSKIPVPKDFIGKTVMDTNIRGRFGLNIIAIENLNEVVETIKPDYEFKVNDIIYLCGNKESVNLFAEWLDKQNNE